MRRDNVSLVACWILSSDEALETAHRWVLSKADYLREITRVYWISDGTLPFYDKGDYQARLRDFRSMYTATYGNTGVDMSSWDIYQFFIVCESVAGSSDLPRFQHPLLQPFEPEPELSSEPPEFIAYAEAIPLSADGKTFPPATTLDVNNR